MESILFLGFTLNAWIVIVTVLLVFILMLCTKLPADFVFLGAMTVLMVTGTMAMDCEVRAGNTQIIKDGHPATDGSGGRTKFFPEQHDRGSHFHQGGKNLVQEAEHRSLQIADTVELCFGDGRNLYPYRYAAQPVDFRFLYGTDRYPAEYLHSDACRAVLSGGGHPVDDSHAKDGTGAQISGRRIGRNE